MNRRLLAALAVILALAGPASASISYDCRHYAKAMGILAACLERWWGTCTGPMCLHGRTLHYSKQDLSDVSEWAVTLTLDTPVAATGPDDTRGADCAAVRAAGQTFRTEALAAMTLFDAAKSACTGRNPLDGGVADDCVAKARAAYEAEVAITGEGKSMDAFVNAAKENGRCLDEKLQFTDEQMNSDTAAAVYVRIKKPACQRDDRCNFVRINGIREARSEMMKIFQEGKDPAPRDLQTAAAACRPLLFSQRGAASDEASDETNGAENLLWKATVYNSYWGGAAKDPTWLLFLGTSKIAQCSIYLEEGWERANCQPVYEADPQAPD